MCFVNALGGSFLLKITALLGAVEVTLWHDLQDSDLQASRENFVGPRPGLVGDRIRAYQTRGNQVEIQVNTRRAPLSWIVDVVISSSIRN